MINGQSGDNAEAIGRSEPAATGGDRDLLALEAQLGDLINQLRAAEKEIGVPTTSSDQLLAVPDSVGIETQGVSAREAHTKHLEAILERLYPIERAIMTAPAYSIIGLGVKARHAAYVMSQFWDEPADKIDWEAQTIRLLIEAVCDVARTPLSFGTSER
jgi:hypothetical protein